MKTAAFLARIGNNVIRMIVTALILVMFSFSAYVLWDSYQTMTGAFASDDLLKYKPSESADPKYTLEQLQAINPDVIGWITVDGTHIDYPLLQGEDDMEYLNKDPFGKYSISGSIYLSSVNKKDFSDDYNIIYGHHMDNGAMFGDLLNFEAANYFRDHPEGVLFLTDRKYRIRFFLCAPVNAYDMQIYSVRRNRSPEAVDKTLKYVRKIAKNERPEVQASGKDKIVVLSTCKGAVTNDRVVLFGVMTEMELTGTKNTEGSEEPAGEGDQAGKADE